MLLPTGVNYHWRVPCRPRPRHMFCNCPVRRSCNKLGALILRRYGKLPAEAREAYNGCVLQSWSWFRSLVECCLCAQNICHQLSQLFVCVITVVGVCRSGTSCDGLLQLQLHVGIVGGKGQKAATWCIIISRTVSEVHFTQVKVSGFAASCRKIHGLYWNQVSNQIRSRCCETSARFPPQQMAPARFLNSDRGLLCQHMRIKNTFAGFPFLTKSRMAAAVMSGCSR